MIFVITQCR